MSANILYSALNSCTFSSFTFHILIVQNRADQLRSLTVAGEPTNHSRYTAHAHFPLHLQLTVDRCRDDFDKLFIDNVLLANLKFQYIMHFFTNLGIWDADWYFNSLILHTGKKF